MRPGYIRIIGGKWRGRKLKVLSLPDLRPTPDRVRETLFNWLMPVIPGSRCLDAFAGTGVLGLEALSRGALHLTCTDQSAEIIAHLNNEISQLPLDVGQIILYRANVPSGLKKPAEPWDIVFLDPPYREDKILSVCSYLEDNNLLAPSAYIYLECKSPIQPDELPNHWEIIKSKKTGQVAYHLIHRQISSLRG